MLLWPTLKPFLCFLFIHNPTLQMSKQPHLFLFLFLSHPNGSSPMSLHPPLSLRIHQVPTRFPSLQQHRHTHSNRGHEIEVILRIRHAFKHAQRHIATISGVDLLHANRPRTLRNRHCSRRYRGILVEPCHRNAFVLQWLVSFPNRDTRALCDKGQSDEDTQSWERGFLHQ